MGRLKAKQKVKVPTREPRVWGTARKKLWRYLDSGEVVKAESPFD